jgi:hypothetical protein
MFATCKGGTPDNSAGSGHTPSHRPGAGRRWPEADRDGRCRPIRPCRPPTAAGSAGPRAAGYTRRWFLIHAGCGGPLISYASSQPSGARLESRRSYTGQMDQDSEAWEIYIVNEVRDWLDGLRDTEPVTFDLIDDAIYALSHSGPALRRPLVGTINGSTIKNLKELRPGSMGRSEIRILFVFDPWRSAILLVAGDKAGNWQRWYRQAIPLAEQRYEIYLKERAQEQR